MRGMERWVALVPAAIALAACSNLAPAGEKLAPVAAAPRPSLPSWIAEIAPTSQAQSLAQIRVIFGKPVTQVTSLEGDGPREVLSHLVVQPAVKGRFVVLTPRMIGFVADQPLPIGARVRVTLTKGLRDLDGDTLANDLTWSFETAPLAFSGLPVATASPGDPTPAPFGLHPSIQIVANAQVDLASLASHARLQGGGTNVALDVKVEPTPSADPSQPETDVTYDLTPRGNLAPSTTYALSITPGVEPAVGNLPTSRTFGGSLHTYDPLVIQATPTPDPNAPMGSSRFAGGDPVITFNNTIDVKTLAGNVTISPQPSPAPKISLSDDDSSIVIDPYALEPNARYTVTVGTGVKDDYGQSLASSATVEVKTTNFAPGAWAPSGTTIIPADSGVDLNFYATNLPGNRYRAAFAPVGALDMLQGYSPDAELPSPAPQWPLATLPNAKTNVQSVVRVNVADRLHASFGSLAYGFWTPIGGSDATATTGIVQLTNLGVFAQFFPAHGRVLVQHLDDGSPVANAAIAVYRLPDNAAPAQCASGSTDAGGALDLRGIDIERCYANGPSNGMPTLGIVARSGADLATLQIYDYSGIYRYDIPYGWAGGAPQGVGTIFPDRDMYQPGESAAFTGVAYYVQRGQTLADTDATYALTLTDPSGKDTKIADVRTDAYGTFSLPYRFAPNQALGYYSLSAQSSNGAKIFGGFRVAEFKPPNFKLSVALDKEAATSGTRVTARANAAYLFGAPLQGGKATIYVTRALAYVAPKGWDTFSFGRQWFWPQEPPGIASDVLQRTESFDDAGALNFGIDVPNDLPAPLTYTVEVQGSDVSNLSVADSQTLLAMPADALIGLSSDTVAAAGTPMPIRVIVTDAQGNAIAGRSVHLELQKMTYVSAAQAQDGGEDAQESIRYDTVDRVDVTSGTAPVTASLTPKDAASYRIRANFSGAPNAASATDVQVFAFGSEAADFGARDTSSVTVTLDKKKYRVGDTATAAIGSPFDRADVYVAVVRHDIIYQTTLKNVAGVPRVSFKITPDMFPNAAIEAVVVRRGPKLASVKPGSLDSLMRTGMAAFNIDLADRYLKLGIAPELATVQPGAKQTVNFTLRDANGKPASGKIIAMAVNDAILQLSGYRLPDLVTTIFSDQPISTRFADNRSNVTLMTQQAPSGKGFGYGGGYLAGAAGTRVRTHFLPLAYYGTTIAGSDGKATVSFSLPDDLTTWRVMAVAVGADDKHFGTSDATFVSALPLMANVLLPQFARPGDLMDVGTSVFNQTGAAGPLDVLLQLTGALHFANGDPVATKLTTQAATGISAYRFAVAVGSPAPSSLSANVALGSARDAFKVPFEIRDRATTESTMDAGVARAANIPVNFDRGGTLTLTLANSIVPQYAFVAGRLLDEESFPSASDLASRLIVDVALSRTGDAASVLGNLLRLQRDDGGFAFCSGAGASDPFATAYALEALSYARSQSVRVPASAMSRASAFASRALADPGRWAWCRDDLCKAQVRFAMLWSLAKSGDRRSDGLASVVAQATNFDSATQIDVARYLLATPGWQSRGKALAQSLEQTLYLTGRYATANLDTPWGWRGDLVTSQANMLQLLMDTSSPGEQIDGAVRALFAQRCACGWSTMQASAAAVLALRRYAASEHLAPMSVTVSSGGKTLTTAQFSAAAKSTTVAIAAASVSGGAIRIRSSGGVVHYTALYTYDVSKDAPGALNAFRVVREVREVGGSTPLATMDLAAMNAPVRVAAGRVFDIGVRVIVDHPVDRVVIEDPLPAGFEAVDAAFRTSTQSVSSASDSWEIGDRAIYKDRVMAFAQHLGPGIYELHYLVRSVTPGTYRWPGARAYLQDAPEEFGRSAMATLEVSD
ncbi:MAG TPA: Ig-like domain-containing protein [Candidatus Baltobacteraceae bacterium]|nr:Ig-like domain-containing protein [Candidatus Baltobacteraceae bacterium]